MVVNDALNLEAIYSHRVTFIPMESFYAQDAKKENPTIGLNELRLCYSYTIGSGLKRGTEIREAGEKICDFLLGKLGLNEPNFVGTASTNSITGITGSAGVPDGLDVGMVRPRRHHSDVAIPDLVVPPSASTLGAQQVIGSPAGIPIKP